MNNNLEQQSKSVLNSLTERIQARIKILKHNYRQVDDLSKLVMNKNQKLFEIKKLTLRNIDLSLDLKRLLNEQRSILDFISGKRSDIGFNWVEKSEQKKLATNQQTLNALRKEYKSSVEVYSNN